jgi:hypothetical protein
MDMMKPIDYRNETWDQVRERVDSLRLAVYRAFELHGACTTRQLAQKSCIDILTLRPRVTELVQLGLVELSNPEMRAGEGIYQAVPWAVAVHRFEKEKARAMEAQLPLL